jgi:2-polyprenyl-3-methyl-5-hydroxy-6-metoxy-1,4-benzoquinol methylase
MSEGWGKQAKGWDSPDTQLYADQAYASWRSKIAPLIPNLAESRVLDFGCGTGLLTERLAPLCGHIVAVDTSRRMIEVLRGKVADRPIDNVTSLITAIDSSAVASYPELAGRFDLIVASSVCSFLPDYEATLRVLASLLRPDGVFAQWDWMSEMPVQRIQDALVAAGLNRVSIDKDFEFVMEDEPMPVVLGIGSHP